MLTISDLSKLAALRRVSFPKPHPVVVNGIVLTPAESHDSECVASTKTDGLESPRLK